MAAGERGPERSGRFHRFRLTVSVDIGGEEVAEEDEEGDEPGGVRGHGWGVFIPIVERVSWSWASVGVSCSFCTR